MVVVVFLFVVCCVVFMAAARGLCHDRTVTGRKIQRKRVEAAGLEYDAPMPRGELPKVTQMNERQTELIFDQERSEEN